ncbi:hypothetical protein ACFLYB_00460 [Chloroflexota bacterium]
MLQSCICQSCGEEVELNRGELPYDVLYGWFMLSCLNGPESTDRYSFCSSDCLQQWLNRQLPVVPEVFIKSLAEENNC